MSRAYALATLVLSLAATSSAHADTAPSLVAAPVEKVFVPIGFDSNDDAEVVVHGHFPSSCYKIGPIKSDVDFASRRVVVRVSAWFYRDGICHPMRVPYVASVKLGPLLDGDYTVRVSGVEAVSAGLPITPATSSNPDDFVYAPVETVELSSDESGRPAVRLAGTAPEMDNGCLLLAETKIMRSDAVFVVLPIARIERDVALCAVQPSRRFSAVVTLPEDTVAGDFLLHVRVLAGQSINRLV
jgi:hypothetical protein